MWTNQTAYGPSRRIRAGALRAATRLPITRIIGFALAAAALGLALPAGETAGSAADTRRTLAEYRLSALDGRETTLASFRGEVVVVSFWASWCASCRGELAAMNRWNEDWAVRGGRVVAISVDRDLRKARRFVADEGLTLTALHDGPDGLVRAIDIPSLPCVILLDRDGRVVTVVRTSLTEDLDALRARAETLLKRPASPDVQSAGMGE